MGGLLLKPSLGNIRAKADWRKVGGAPLLGVNGVCVIAHGRSDAEAMKNAVLKGAEAVRGRVVEEMSRSIADSRHLVGENLEGGPTATGDAGGGGALQGEAQAVPAEDRP